MGEVRYALVDADDAGSVLARAAGEEGLFLPPKGDDRAIVLRDCTLYGDFQDWVERLTAASPLGRRRAERERREAYLELLDVSGKPVGSYLLMGLLPVGVRRAARGFDVTLTCQMAEEPSPEAAGFWRMLQERRLTRKGIWLSLEPEARKVWMEVALNHHSVAPPPDSPPGEVYEIDGAQVTDEMSFYCALGEAINGPCGYFGWNLDALDDCLFGGWGASTPFTLIWNNSSASARALSTVYPGEAPGTTVFDVLLGILRDGGVRVLLR